MSQEAHRPDYLAPDISELSNVHGKAAGLGATEKEDTQKSHMTRSVAKRLLPSCVVTPALLWWALWFGARRGLYSIETCFTLFVFSVTVVFGVIVCLHLRRLAKMEAQRSEEQEQLKLAKNAAEAANRFKSAFFANISHEIRTPLTAINGFAELLLNPERTNDQRFADARVIRRNGEHLLTLINDILDLSKIEAGKMSVDPILCCPAQILGEVISMLRHRASEKGISLEIKFDGPIPQRIRTDPTRLRQVLINLVANAIKFTREGGVKLTAKVKPSFKALDPKLEVTIADTGIGIPEEQLASLFQPFVQGDQTISRQYGGSGLGLAISRHFAQALGGDIKVASSNGSGSTFTVTVGTGSLADELAHEDPEQAMEQQLEIASQRVRINGSVLVAEDGADNQALIAAKLREAGMEVTIAPNGQIACEKAMEVLDGEMPFDLILMDVQMPVMDGFTATHTLRSKGYRGPIIALTANAMERDRNKCLNAGCNDFVTKPIQMDKLFKAIGRYLTVTAIVDPNSKAGIASAALVQKFYEELPEELAQIQQAIERYDRVLLRESVQLLLGKAAHAGVKELAPQAARLMQLAETEQSWTILGEEAAAFIRDCQTQPQREAA